MVTGRHGRKTAGDAVRGDATGPWSPPLVLFAASGATAVFAALAGALALGAVAATARPREITLFWLLRFACDAAGWSLLRASPAIVNAPFDLRTLHGATQFSATVVGVNLLLSWAAASALLPFLCAVRHRLGSREGGSGWMRNLPPVAFALFALPGLVGVMNAWFRTRRIALTFVAAVAAAVALWLVLRLVCASVRRARALLSGATALAVAMTLLVALPAAATIGTRSRRVAVPPPPPAGSPNVLLVSIDSLRRDHLHCYGYPRETSPTIDRLAREGAMFRTVVSPTSWTLPAHLTLLTALPPEVHGVVVDGRRLARRWPTLAEVLSGGGWTTAGFVSGAYLDALYGFSRGFDSYDDYSLVRSSPRFAPRSVSSPALADEVTAWLLRWREAAGRRPFFLFVHMFDVHYDYDPPPPYRKMFDPDYPGPLRESQFRLSAGLPEHLTPRDLQHLIALYDGEIRFTDHHLGRIIEQLRRLDVLDDTIVVVTSDHGEEFFEHGHAGHRQSLYDELVLVPLVVRYPRRVSPGRTVDGQVRLMDVAPTILSLAGVAAPGFGTFGVGRRREARDLTPTLAADAPSPDLVAFGDLEGKLASIRSGGLKYVRGEPGPGEELYDLRLDPGERHNLLGERRSVSLALGVRLAHWRQESAVLRRGARAEVVAVDAEHRERLRALGYVQ